MPGRSRRRASRLSPDDWFRCAFDTLVEEGTEGLRIARIARRLGVTSGSFYWHFRDREDFQERMLASWVELVDGIGRAAGPGGAATTFDDLRKVLPAQRLPELDLTLRVWARRDAAVAKAVAKADALRIGHCERMLRDAGLDARLAAKRAPLVIWAHVGSSGADPVLRTSALAELLQLLPTAKAPKRKVARAS